MTYGVGISSRSRSCTNPSPQVGGNPCEGEDTETQECGMLLCTGNYNFIFKRFFLKNV